MAVQLDSVVTDDGLTIADAYLRIVPGAEMAVDDVRDAAGAIVGKAGKIMVSVRVWRDRQARLDGLRPLQLAALDRFKFVHDPETVIDDMKLMQLAYALLTPALEAMGYVVTPVIEGGSPA